MQFDTKGEVDSRSKKSWDYCCGQNGLKIIMVSCKRSRTLTVARPPPTAAAVVVFNEAPEDPGPLARTSQSHIITDSVLHIHTSLVVSR